jgi:hypothetical protein
MEKNQIRNFTPLLPYNIETQFFIHKFLIVPSCPAPLLGQKIMEKLDMVLLMGHFPGLLMLQKGSQKHTKFLWSWTNK